MKYIAIQFDEWWQAEQKASPPCDICYPPYPWKRVLIALLAIIAVRIFVHG